MFPVMIVGTFISGKKYSFKDYAIALSITLGCVLFLLTGVSLSPSLSPPPPFPSHPLYISPFSLKTSHQDLFGALIFLYKIFNFIFKRTSPQKIRATPQSGYC
jgi:hypothetical protein